MKISIEGIDETLKPGQMLKVTAEKEDGSEVTFNVKCRIDTNTELHYYKNGGILHYVLRQMLDA